MEPKRQEQGKKRTENTRILSHEEIAQGIYDLRLQTTLAGDAVPGQFVGVYTGAADQLLPRPISVCDADAASGILRLVYRVSGKGTAQIARKRTGETLRLLGMLGNGFPLEKAKGRHVILTGGGIGIPPLLFTAKRLTEAEAGNGAEEKASGTSLTVIPGYRDAETFLAAEFPGRVLVATEDGSVGTGGNVLDVLRTLSPQAPLIFACGPAPMLRAVKAFAEETPGAEAYLSMEERMACGVGACLGCVIRTAAVDAHSHVHNARCCTEGPVFRAADILL